MRHVFLLAAVSPPIEHLLLYVTATNRDVMRFPLHTHAHISRTVRIVPMVLTILALGHVVTFPRLTAQAPAARQPSVAAPLVFQGVTVIDVTDGRLLPNHTVVVSDNRVRAVGPADKVRPPQGAQVVAASGKYLIPGLWDMHAHVNDQGRTRYPRYIAHGVTGLREMAQRFPNGSDSFVVWQREIMAGTQIGPRVVGPSADLGGGSDFQTPDGGARIMDSLKAAGVVFVKYHGGDSRTAFFAMAREARRVGLPLVGHANGGAYTGFATPMTNVEASDSGLRSIEHLEENHQCWGLWPNRGDTVMPGSAAMAAPCGLMTAAYIRNGTWITPTLGMHEAFPALHQIFPGMGDPGEPSEDDIAERNHIRARDRSFIRRVHDLGFRRFLAGTDAFPGSHLQAGRALHLPGLSLLWELVLLVKAGLSPLEALQAATLHPAQFFEATDSLGTVAPGKLADLVLLDANPLEDITNTTAIRAVVANGRYYDRAALDALDPEGVALTKQVAEYR